jgi:hypothetical protein
MEVLARTAVAFAIGPIAIAGCYSPSLDECTVACAGSADCGPGQQCGGDGWCASPQRSGRCAQLVNPDAEIVTSHDARIADATDAMQDPTDVELRIRIQGSGHVLVAGYGTCMPTEADACTYRIASGTSIQLEAQPDGERWRFASWKDGRCNPDVQLCWIVMMTDASETAVFKKTD